MKMCEREKNEQMTKNWNFPDINERVKLKTRLIYNRESERAKMIKFYVGAFGKAHIGNYKNFAKYSKC